MERTYEDGKARNRIVEPLGREDRLQELHEDPRNWAESYVADLNNAARTEPELITATWDPAVKIPVGKPALFNGGYLFLQKIYYELSLPRACREIQKKAKAEFNLNSILSSLIYCRVIEPGSKRATVLDHAPALLERKQLDLHTVYRALSLLAANMDRLQVFLYKQSKKLVQRADHILYYDVTNFYWEIEEEDDFRKYGHSKEHRPNPIVQMGLFMDGSGLPLAFSLSPGNTNEQVMLKPLEEKIIHDFEHAKFVTCTDAGLSSKSNRLFNDKKGRAFVTTQALKKLDKNLRDWVFSPGGWKKSGDKNGREWTLDAAREAPREAVFYKERWIKDGKLEQRLIVTFSRKYMEYQRSVRNGQIERAQRMLERGKSKLRTKGAHDPRRFITNVAVTDEGEIAGNQIYALDQERIDQEAAYDGFYAVCTNLEDDIQAIVRINKRRWEIEEAFRIMKHDLEARPVYLSRQDRIEAHFLTCFISLLILRLVERRLMDAGFRELTLPEIISTLRKVRYNKSKDLFFPAFERTRLTEAFEHTFGLPIQQEAYGRKQMRSLIAGSRK